VEIDLIFFLEIWQDITRIRKSIIAAAFSNYVVSGTSTLRLGITVHHAIPLTLTTCLYMRGSGAGDNSH
jgi:hypothetical protein